MIGVILGILKVIGILLLVLLGLLLLVCVCVLFVPVRYRGAVSKQPGEALQASGEISWLLHLLHISVEKQETGAAVTVRIFGISPEMVRDFRKKRQKKKAAKKRRQAEQGKRKTETKQIDKKGADTVRKEPVQKKTSVQKTERARQDTSTVKQLSAEFVEKDTATSTEQSGVAKKVEKGKNNSGQTVKKGSLCKKISGIYKKIVALPKRILNMIRKFIKKVTDIRQSISALRAFINRQEVRSAASLVWKKALRLLKGICPRKLEGHLLYGCSDPADTGMVLAVLGALYPIYGSSVSVTPDFQQKTFEASLKGRGRVYGILVLVTGLQLYFDKNIQFIIKNRKKEA